MVCPRRRFDVVFYNFVTVLSTVAAPSAFPVGLFNDNGYPRPQLDVVFYNSITVLSTVAAALAFSVGLFNDNGSSTVASLRFWCRVSILSF